MNAYELITEKIEEKLAYGEITIEQALNVNDIAYDKYICEKVFKTKAEREAEKEAARIQAEKEAKIASRREKWDNVKTTAKTVGSKVADDTVKAGKAVGSGVKAAGKKIGNAAHVGANTIKKDIEEANPNAKKVKELMEKLDKCSKTADDLIKDKSKSAEDIIKETDVLIAELNDAKQEIKAIPEDALTEYLPTIITGLASATVAGGIVPLMNGLLKQHGVDKKATALIEIGAIIAGVWATIHQLRKNSAIVNKYGTTNKNKIYCLNVIDKYVDVLKKYKVEAIKVIDEKKYNDILNS